MDFWKEMGGAGGLRLRLRYGGVDSNLPSHKSSRRLPFRRGVEHHCLFIPRIPHITGFANARLVNSLARVALQH